MTCDETGPKTTEQRRKEQEEVHGTFADVPLGDQQAAYERRRAEAMALEDVPRSRIDEELAYNNVRIGLASFLTMAAQLFAIPGVRADILQRVEDAALGLLYCARRLPMAVEERVAAAVDLAELRLLRVMMIDGYRNVARKNHVPMERLQSILPGNTTLDTIADCLNLAGLFREYAKELAGRTSLTPDDIARAETLAQRARDLLAVEGAITSRTTGERKALLDETRRFTALLERDHDVLLSLAPHFFGKKHKDRVPKLQSRRGLPRLRRKPAPETVETTPSAS